tara:strand:+ start:442 stop:798 length:357 start_codon:yes stop_codon:yes gene_type:complete
MPKNRYGGVDTHAAFFVSIKAKSMIKTGLFRPEDKEDIEQELMMAYLKDEGNFKGDRAEKDVFTRMVINHRSIQMIRQQLIKEVREVGRALHWIDGIIKLKSIERDQQPSNPVVEVRS